MFDSKSKAMACDLAIEFPAGMKFEYLGREMIVIDHWINSPAFGPIPGLRAHYFNNAGELREVAFLLREVDAVRQAIKGK